NLPKILDQYSWISEFEIKLGQGALFCRTAGSTASVSTWKICRLMPTCMSVVGQVSNGRDDQF
ncbi:hypothetical protein EWB00_010159, partial [Schistosoma japonicum]